MPRAAGTSRARARRRRLCGPAAALPDTESRDSRRRRRQGGGVARSPEFSEPTEHIPGPGAGAEAPGGSLGRKLPRKDGRGRHSDRCPSTSPRPAQHLARLTPEPEIPLGKPARGGHPARPRFGGAGGAVGLDLCERHRAGERQPGLHQRARGPGRSYLQWSRGWHRPTRGLVGGTGLPHCWSISGAWSGGVP